MNTRRSSATHTRRRGSAMIYVIMGSTVFLGVAALAVDMGRIATAKTELQTATDAAARYAAAAMRTQMNNTSAAAANASAVFAENRADGTTINFNPATDLVLGIWTPGTRTFVPATVAAGANAVQIHTEMVLGDAARPLTFASVLGKSAKIHASSVVSVTTLTATAAVTSMGNPWLAGMPDGSVSNNFRTKSKEWDYAKAGDSHDSTPTPIGLASLGVTPGMTILFDGVTGATDHTGAAATGDADGDANKLDTLGSPTHNDFTYFSQPMNGMSNVKAPINSMIAVFLGPDVPSNTAAPAPLDFGTPASRDFTTLSPQLKQVFFVGNARRDNGEAQQFVVPAGATRVFIGNMDAWEWNNNKGGYSATIHATTKVTTVK